MSRKIKASLGIIILLNLFIQQCFTFAITKKVSNLIETRSNFSDSVYEPSCKSQIYCTGLLLDTVQMAGIFKDSKTFVDMPLKNPPNETLAKFNKLMEQFNNKLSKNQIDEFVAENFNDAGHELIPWTPTDWKENPKFLKEIRDPELRQWGRDLNDLWKILGRNMIPEVKKNPEYYSLIPVDYPFIVPGGRFREIYYWDSYWIIRGILKTEMYDTARGMLNNFLSLIENYGFIPNGARIYYLKRSQPPLLAPMIKSYIETTKDYQFAINSVKTLEKEFLYFWNNYMHDVKGYHLAAYGGVHSSGPRPESYSEDVQTASSFNSDEEKQKFYNHIKAAAESGMDFSSRFFITTNGSTLGRLKDIKAGHIISVELNAYLYGNAKIISEFYLKAGNIEKSIEFEEKALKILQAIEAVLWHDDIGAWLDWDMINNKRRNFFTPTNLSPLWMYCFNTSKSVELSKKILNYLNSTRVDNFPGGVPNTLYMSSEQWDLPNVWPPMQYMLIVGLENLGTPEAIQLSKKWATRWVQSNYAAYKDEKYMYEKYNAEEFGGHGGGGEYDTQIGFGWSNGVIIEFLSKYGKTLTTTSTGKPF